jgi:CRP/FNR family transcriptional regulator, cyclic AMP receptor protein
MSLIPDATTFQKKLAKLPLATFQPGERVFTAGSRTDHLLILKKGSVAVLKDGIEIATVAEPGAVFGELAALLDRPHTADVHALETSEFHVAGATALLVQDPVALLYIAAVVARRLDGANRALVELKGQLTAGQPRSVITKTVETMEGLLGSGGPSLFAGPL